MKLLFIDQNSEYYREAVELRISLFFRDLDNANELIDDTYEKQSKHLVCLSENQVVGTGRLTTENNQGIISQMAIKEEFQENGIGSKILSKLMNECSALGVNQITLSARKTAIDFYKRFGFEAYGDYYQSEKTGIIHQDMSKKEN